MKNSDFIKMWNEDGTVSDEASEWVKVRAEMVDAFPAYHKTPGADPFAIEVGNAINELSKLKPEVDGPAYLGNTPDGPFYKNVTKARLPAKRSTLEEVNLKSVALFDGMPNWNHPLTMPNVIPPANKAGIIAAMMTDLYGPNIIEGEYSWNVLKSEMESAAIISALIGWDTEKSGGVYTFGGSGCYLYGIKYGLTRALGIESRCNGIREDAKLIVSQQGHYCKMNSSDWTGLGINNIVEIETDSDTNAMDIAQLELKMKEFHQAGTPIAAVVCTMGTTDSFAIDSPKAVRALIDKYPNPNGTKALLYCDAVIGWSWLTFKDYDFIGNPLNFCEATKINIANNLKKIQEIEYADAVGCDFHKTGWAPYNCSMVVMRDLNEFRNLMSRPGSAYLQERTCYNPGLFTLEVSRSGSYSMAGWATLQFFGAEGFQSILGGVLQIEEYLRDRIKEITSMVCVNNEDHGFVTLLRVYPEGVNAKAQYEKELNDPSAKAELVAHNELQKLIANKLWSWFRDGKTHGGDCGPYISYTSGFRKTTYNRDGDDSEAVIYALKSFPMNLNINPFSMEQLLALTLRARDEVLAKTSDPESEKPSGCCSAPYDKQLDEFKCSGTESGDVCHAVENLLSGVPR